MRSTLRRSWRCTGPTLVAGASLLAACDRDGPRPSAAADTVMHPESAAVVVAQAPRPVPRLRFEDYPVGDTALRRRRPAPVNLASAAYGRTYRTRIREGAAAGPNFAGHYTVVYWGCGTGCQVVAVVDARTGRLSRQTLLTANGVQYRRDSRLLFADPPAPEQPPNCASCGTPAYYEWRGGAFHPVGPGPHIHLGGPRSWSSECAPSDTGTAATTGPYTCAR